MIMGVGAGAGIDKGVYGSVVEDNSGIGGPAMISVTGWDSDMSAGNDFNTSAS